MKKILIVDDKKNVRNSLSIGLKREGYYVDVADGAQEAISKLNSDDFDVLLSDVKMPDKNGFELAMEIAQLHPQVQTILMSAYNFKDYEERYEQADRWPKISKPFAMNELVALLENRRRKQEAETTLAAQ
ncbi:MAG: response regulator [candidate division KSB1 bacterium]|nr:response regulator [candidate division KSB1 bacterium]MDZ7318318.1 response regulator [candidate division KSB1 bacterium]MDZ7340735.1 response regulator [candidate division KSB1 bacterium]